MSRQGYVPSTLFQTGDDQDPRSFLNYGYRSSRYRQSLPSQNTLASNFTDVSVAYNNFWFPPINKTRCTIVPEYDSSGRGVKYVTIAITVEAIITQNDKLAPTVNDPDTDRIMDKLRLRLVEPGQPLIITGHGLGKIVVNDSSNPDTLYDLDYGPKTQVVDWEPIAGGLASRIEWLVTTRLPACTASGEGDGFFWFLNNDASQGFIDFQWEASWAYDELGFMTKNVKGSVEIALARTPQQGDSSADANLDLDAVMAKFQQAQDSINNLFPLKEGFKRTRDFSISKSKKILSFNIVDTEIPSPIGLPNGPIQFDLEESLGSSLKDGFRMWKWRLSGSIRCPYTKVGSDIINNKRLAFTAFYIVLQDRLSRTSGQTFPIQKETGSLPDGSPAPATELKEVVYYPNKINISNEIFGTGINVDIEYLVICSAPLIMVATGMFDALQSLNRFDWSSYRQFLEEGVVIPNTVTGVLPGVDWVVDFCHGFPNHFEPIEDKSDNAQGSSATSNACPAPEKSWLSYNNEFEIVNNYNTISLSYLDDAAVLPQDDISNELESDSIAEVALNSQSSVSDNTSPIELSTSGEPVTYITMRGEAVRLGYPIQPPRLTAVLKDTTTLPAIHVGQDRIVQQTKPLNMTKTIGATEVACNMYKLTWERTYAVQGVVTTVNPATSGQPTNFLSNTVA